MYVMANVLRRAMSMMARKVFVYSIARRHDDQIMYMRGWIPGMDKRR